LKDINLEELKMASAVAQKIFDETGDWQTAGYIEAQLWLKVMQ